ncbi:MAG: hypothetical protein KC731_16670, partial [Myxococcales bacterium]|nr:hypothetical protein [Myxococcales bacterium]
MSLVDVVSWLFSALSIAALSFFLHKVAWLVRYKNLQRDLLRRAAEAEEGARLEATKAWDDFAAAAWRVARGPAALDEGEVQGPDAYADAVEAELSASVDAVEARRPVRDVILETLKRTRRGDVLHHVVEVPSRRDERARASLCIDPPLVAEPPAPPEDAFTLDVKSRYGFWRRALVFVLGAADVVYSSRHVARMSQNAQVPTGVILRRLSLVVVILGAIVVDIAFSLRARLIDWVDAALGPPPHLAGSLGTLGEWIDPHLGAAIALTGWLAVYGAIYFGLFLY